MMRMTIRITLIFLVFLAGCSQAEAGKVQVYDYEIINSYPHDPAAYTQGLIWLDGHLYESTGRRGQSSLRKVDLTTGTVLQRQEMEARYFGEGIVEWGDRIIGLTWQSGTGFVFDRDDFELRQTFSYSGEGWGLTRDERQLYMSDGTAEIRKLDPETLTETGRFTVTYDGKPVRALNELEWVNGEIFANVYQTDLIVRFSPETGVVTGVIDLSGILPAAERQPGYTDVLNGIAYDQDTDRLFVTGKYWPKLFEIRLVERTPA